MKKLILFIFAASVACSNKDTKNSRSSAEPPPAARPPVSEIGQPADTFYPNGLWANVPEKAGPVKVVITLKNADGTQTKIPIEPTGALPEQFALKNLDQNTEIFHNQWKAVLTVPAAHLGLGEKPLKVGLLQFGNHVKGVGSAPTVTEANEDCTFSNHRSLAFDFISSKNATVTFVKRMDLTSANGLSGCSEAQKLFLTQKWLTNEQLSHFQSITFTQPLAWTQVSKRTPNLPSCDWIPPFITGLPIDANYFGGLVPLGSATANEHFFPTDHVYFYHWYNPNALLRSPLTGRIKQVVRVHSKSANGTENTDYNLTLQTCREVAVTFGHVGAFYTGNPSLDAFNKDGGFEGAACETYGLGTKYTTCTIKVEDFDAKKAEDFDVLAGVPLGSFNNVTPALDMGVTDARKENFYLNPVRHQNRNSFCPVDYADDKTAKLMLARFSSSENDFLSVAKEADKKIGKGPCGTMEFDLDKTPRGYWYLSGSTAEELKIDSLHMVLMWNLLDPTWQVFQIGSSGNAIGMAGTWAFKTSATSTDSTINVPFEKATATGKVYCYDVYPASTNKKIPDPDQNTPYKTLLLKFEGAKEQGKLTLGTREQSCTDQTAPIVMPPKTVSYMR